MGLAGTPTCNEMLLDWRMLNESREPSYYQPFPLGYFTGHFVADAQASAPLGEQGGLGLRHVAAEAARRFSQGILRAVTT